MDVGMRGKQDVVGKRRRKVKGVGFGFGPSTDVRKR